MMGDIVQTGDTSLTLRVEVATQSPIERVEIRNGFDVLHTARGYGEDDLGERVRVVWSGAEYRGRGRETNWKGRATFNGAAIKRIAKINAFNHERTLEQQGTDTVVFDAITTGNFGGFDAWLEPGKPGDLAVTTNHGSLILPLAEVGLEDAVFEAGGLERKLRAFRLPEENTCLALDIKLDIALKPDGDNPIWVCVTTEDGFQAWSSPIYAFN
jgi:hypothetical protein